MAYMRQLVDAWQHLMEMLGNPDVEVDEQTIIDTMESIDGEIEDKADNIAFIISQIKADVEAIKAEEKRLSERRKRLENRLKRLTELLYDSMVKTGKRQFNTALHSFSIKKNGGQRALVLDCGVDMLPPQYQKVTLEANNEALRNLLKENGSCEWCHLAEQGEHLEVK